MKRWMILLGIFTFFAFLMVGCEKNTTDILSDEALEETELQQFVQDDQNDYLFDWGIDDESEQNMFDGYSDFSYSENAGQANFNKVLFPLSNVVRFGRKIDKRFPRTLVVRRISRDSVMVYLERVLVGRFFIFEKLNADSTDPDTMAVYKKPLRHIVRRKAIFVKRTAPVTDTNSDQTRRGHWRLAEISLTQGNSPHSTIRIEEVVIRTSNGDTLVFTHPLDTQIQIPDGLPTFERGETVEVTVRLINSTPNPVLTDNGATETVLLHFGRNRKHHGRKRFEFVGTDGDVHIYKGSWVVREPVARPYHAIVDVIDNGTIYDNDPEAYPYNSTTWGAPYRVVLNK